MSSGQLTENDVERIIERITVTTDTKRLKDWLKKEYPAMSDEDIKYISKLKYKDYGRLSRRFLEEVFEIVTKTGETVSDKNIISALWETNDNLMQLLGSKYRYAETIENLNKKYYYQHAWAIFIIQGSPASSIILYISILIFISSYERI